MTPLDLTPIKDREAKASKGPWMAAENPKSSFDEEHYSAIDSIHWGHLAEVCTKTDAEDDDDEEGVANFDFILNSRTDIPTLIAEVERLRAILGEKA